MFRTVQTYLIITFNLLIFSYVADKAAARAHAVSTVKYIRTWSNRIFMTGLSKERNVDEQKKILDELFRRLVDPVAQSPVIAGTITSIGLSH